MPGKSITKTKDELGEYWIYPDGSVTVHCHNGDMIMSSPNGPDMTLHLDGSITSTSMDGVTTHQSPGGAKYTWSSRDEKWISFNRELDGSRWERHPDTGQLVERETPHSERPQGSWITPDERTVVTEINHHLFRVQDGHYSIRYNSDLPDRGPMAGKWQQVTEEVWHLVRADNERLEGDHRNPELVKSMAVTDAAMGLLATGMHVYLETFIAIGGTVGGPAGRAMEKAYEGLQLQEQFRGAKSSEDVAGILVDNYNPLNPGNLAGNVFGHGVSRGIDRLGKVDVPDLPHGTARPATGHDIPGPDAPGPGRHPSDGPATQPVGDIPGPASGAPAPAATPAPAKTPAPDTSVGATTPLAPATKDANTTAPPDASATAPAPSALGQPVDHGIPADPFAARPLTTAQDHTQPGARPAEPTTPGTAPLPPGAHVQHLPPGRVDTDGPTVNVKDKPLPEDLDGLTVTGSPNQRTSGSNKHYEILEARLGDPPGLREHWSPHHIVPTNEGGAALDDLRHRMKEAGIDPDDPRNGVWLPKNFQVPNETGALPHGTWVHAGRQPSRVAEKNDVGDSAGGRGDLSYTLWKRTEHLTHGALRDELAKIKAEMSGDSDKVFHLDPAPNGWKGAIKPDDRPGPEGSDGHSPGGGQDSATPGGTKGATTAPAGTGHSPEPGKHAAAAEPTSPPFALPAPPPDTVVAVAKEPEPGSAAAGWPDLGPQVVADVGAGVDATGDRGAISQDGTGPATTPGGGTGDIHHHGPNAGTVGRDGMHLGSLDANQPGGDGPATGTTGTPHPAAAPPDGSANTIPGTPLGKPHSDPDPLHPLHPAAADTGALHGVGTPDQLYPDGQGHGPYVSGTGGISGAGDHAVGLPNDPIGSFAAADSHAGVGLPAATGQDPHAQGSQNPNHPHDDKATDDAIHPELHPPIQHQPPPPPDPHPHQQLQYQPPPVHHQPPPEQHPLITQVPHEAGGGGGGGGG